MELKIVVAFLIKTLQGPFQSWGAQWSRNGVQNLTLGFTLANKSLQVGKETEPFPPAAQLPA